MIAHRKSVSRIIALPVLLMCCSLGTSMLDAHASISTQGATIQGATIQGATIQGATIQGATIQRTGSNGLWLRGPRLIGVLARAADGSSDALLEIPSFRGDTVIAVIDDVVDGSQERVELRPSALVGVRSRSCKPWKPASIFVWSRPLTVPDSSLAD